MYYFKRYTTDYDPYHNDQPFDSIMEEFKHMEKVAQICVNDKELSQILPRFRLVYIGKNPYNYGLLTEDGGIPINCVAGMTSDLQHKIVNYFKQLFDSKSIKHYDLCPRNM